MIALVPFALLGLHAVPLDTAAGVLDIALGLVAAGVSIRLLRRRRARPLGKRSAGRSSTPR
jgi:hypothetical protein